jgi:hypothetical protein
MNAFDVTAGFDTESRNAGIRVETLNLLFDSHQREDVVDPLLDRKVGILKWILLS